MTTLDCAVPKTGVGRGIIAGLIVCVSMLAACGDDTTEPDPPKATEVSISPESVTLTTIGETRMFVGSIADQYGNSFPGTLTWSSSAPGVFTVDSNGLVTAVANGSGTVTASFESLSASASVTVDANLPPTPRSAIDDVRLSVGGGVSAIQPAPFFVDPDNDILDLTFTTRFGDDGVAASEVRIDAEGHVAILLLGTAVGTTDLTIIATDPGGLSAEQSLAVTVDGDGFTPSPGFRVSDNKIEIAGLALVGRCSPPLEDFVTVAGFIFTINGSGWQSRSDSAADWANIAGTANTEGRLCPYTTTVAGEYRLVFHMTARIDEHSEPFSGAYRSENTFTVVDTVTTGNRAPVLSPDAFEVLPLAAGGGPLPLLAGRFLTDPDGDALTFAISNADTASVSAELIVDTAGHSIAILTGKAVGTSMVTVTATDTGGLGTDWEIAVSVDDSGATPWPAVYVANGILIAFGNQLAVCMPPVINFESVDGNTYTVHESKWQSRGDSSEAWSDIAGTQIMNGQVCPYTATDPGDYRVVYEMSIQVDPHVPATRGWYRSPNHFTVSSGGDHE
ncbi:MAG: Ig-like domain-containing protein [Gemmatimonadetes bacterium]|nr:Ig-like domain-containing protein [Gemmatimonadota bacterium]